MARNLLITILAAIVVAVSISNNVVVVAQNCGCAPNLCSSQFGFRGNGDTYCGLCGTGDLYCGQGCPQGPCSGIPSSGGSVAQIVTPQFFNGIIDQAGASCAGKNFYTRNAFLSAVDSFNQFGKIGSADDSKREIAAFFAHVTYLTDFCFIEAIDTSSQNYCDNGQFPCNPNKKYFGRGPIQITWNYNYIPAGQSIGFDGLNSPETVGSDPVVAFKTGLWFWMRSVRPVVSLGFGATIRAVDGQCNGARPDAVQARVRYYQDYCRQLGVAPGNNLSC